MNHNLKDHGVVAILLQNNKILLLKESRDLMYAHWGPPHGRCELTDPSEEAAVVREVLEETGLQVTPIKKLWTTDADTKVKTISFWEVRLVKGDIKIDPAESSEYGWFAIEDVTKLLLYPATSKFFQLIKEQKIQLS